MHGLCLGAARQICIHDVDRHEFSGVVRKTFLGINGGMAREGNGRKPPGQKLPPDRSPPDKPPPDVSPCQICLGRTKVTWKLCRTKAPTWQKLCIADNTVTDHQKAPVATIFRESAENEVLKMSRYKEWELVFPLSGQL